MQLSSVIVRIEGNQHHAVPKQNVTPAEIIVLRQIHGQDAVVDVYVTGESSVPHQAEFDRLKTIYGSAGAMSADQKPGVVLDQLFPGAIKKLPVTLAEIGVVAGQAPAPPPAPAQEEEIVDEHKAEPAGAVAEPGAEGGEEGAGEEGRQPEAAGFPGWPAQG